MNCPCGAELRVTHTYRAGETARTSVARCDKCKRTHTIIAFLVASKENRHPKWGRGASALARKLREGLIHVRDVLSE